MSNAITLKDVARFVFLKELEESMAKHPVRSAIDTLEYVKDGLNGFLRDPPDSDYQRGYLAALFEVKKFLTIK